MNRRDFTKSVGITTIGAPMLGSAMTEFDKAPFKGKLSISQYSIGVDYNMNDLVDAAINHGFDAIVGQPELLQMTASQQNELRSKMRSNGVSWGSSNLPLEFRKSEEQFKSDLRELPAKLEIYKSIGINKMSTWIMPTHETLTYVENLDRHAYRLAQAANILGHYGFRMGLEYVGPKTLLIRDRYPFISSMVEGKILLDAIGEDNVGFVLDSFHWYCAEESASDILTLDASDIVTVDLNDARSGFTPKEQIDSKRELPGDTGVIDIRSFVGALNQIGYDGPMRAEPFNAILEAMDNETALTTTMKALKKVTS